MTDLTTIAESIGGLKAQVENLANEQKHARSRDTQIFQRLEDIRVVLVTNASIPERLKDVETIAQDYKNMKRVGGVIYMVSIAIAAGVSWFVQIALGWIHKA